jgi:hypothetical protein
MMATKVAIQVMVFALVFFIMLATHPAWGEQECCAEKDAVIHNCMRTITIVGGYVDPSSRCRATVQESDMACVCRAISVNEQLRISVVKLVRLARQCGKLVPVGSKCGSK